MQRIARGAALVSSHAVVASCLYQVGYRTGVNDMQSPHHVFESEVAAEAKAKAELLAHLAHRAYVKLAPSSISGVGVVAIRDIPTGIDPFIAPNAQLRGQERSVRLSKEALQRCCPPAVYDLVRDFHDDDDGSPSIGVNACAMVAMDSSWYLNHCDESPNMEPYHRESSGDEEGGRSTFNSYRTTREVRAGEELLIDYRTALPSVHQRLVKHTLASK